MGQPPQDLAEGLWLPFRGEKAPAAAKGVPAATKRCLLLGLAASQHKLIQLSAQGGLPGDSAEAISFISASQKPVKAASALVLVG